MAALLPEGRFLEILVDTPPDVCRQRDPKGFNGKANRGELVNLAGRDHPCEPPEEPVLRTAELGVEEAADRVVAMVLAKCGQP